MALPNSGPLSLSSIQGEFGGSNPISLSEYYRGGPLVAAIANTSPIPSSGAIAVSNFYGTSASVPNDLTGSYKFGSNTTGGKFPTTIYSPTITSGNNGPGGAWFNQSFVSASVPATMADHRTNQVFLTISSVVNFSASIPAAFFNANNTMTSNGVNFQGTPDSSAGTFNGPKPGSSFVTACHVNTLGPVSYTHLTLPTICSV